MRHTFISYIFLLLCSTGFAQTTFVTNGPDNPKPGLVAYTHAHVYINAKQEIINATIVVDKGKIISILANGNVPVGAREINLVNKIVYPSFVDLYSNYGVQLPTFARNTSHGEQFNSNKAGAFAWNEALKPEIDASIFFAPNATAAQEWRNMGFAQVLTGNMDGICRGTTALVSTAQRAPHLLILEKTVTGSMSFAKGSSPQPYPSSLMGSIALIRQTYYDGQWYEQQQAEKNLSLEAFNRLKKLPIIFDAGNKQQVLRASAIANEFNANYLIKTNGDDYQRIPEIKQIRRPLIVPINFPKPYKINDVFDADLISTADLKHWELAPANPYFLWKNGIPFCLTAYGCKPSEFLSNLRKAVQYGLPQAEALYALTQYPATLIGQQQRIGQLQKGMDASFIICSGSLFDERTVLLAHVVQGEYYEINPDSEWQLADEYLINGDNNNRLYPKKQIALLGQDTFKLNSSLKSGIITFILDGKRNLHYTARVEDVDSTSFPFIIKKLSGFEKSIRDNQSVTLTALTQSRKPSNELSASILLPDSMIWYPFNDYGQTTLPKQENVLFRNTTVWTNTTQGILKETDVIVRNGKISAIGKQLTCNDCKIIDGSNKHLTNGIIDEHSHIAITHGVNEGTQAVTSEVRISDVINADDINIYRQLAGGVVAAQLLHGSANPIGGQSGLIKLKWGFAPEQLKIPNTPGYIKFALGENVKQANWGDQATTRYPQTRMGVEQVFVDAFTRTKTYEAEKAKNPLIRKNLELEALSEVLHSKRFITCHSYVQSEINMLMHVADSFGFKVNTFTHILEGYKVADKMKKHGVNASTFADWWAYKYEVMDAIPQNAGIMHRMGITVAINSDDAEMGRRLNQEAAKIIKYTGISEEDAWKMVTLNPAKMLRIDQRTGSISNGKDADLVLWNNNPLSIYAKPEMTFVDGICFYSITTDLQLRNQIAKTRTQIISKMMEAQKNGAETQNHISEQEPNYHCND